MCNIGDKVKILSVAGFNDRFVKVGDIASIDDIYDGGDIKLSCNTWGYNQYTRNFLMGSDWEIVTPEQVLSERKL